MDRGLAVRARVERTRRLKSGATELPLTAREQGRLGLLPRALQSFTETTTISYDPLYRVTGATYAGGLTNSYGYAYDAVGNRTVQTQTITSTLVTNYGYDIANRLTSVNGQTYTWDDNGNLLNDGAQTYTYDQANRLKQATQGVNTYAFGYNGVGDRLRQTVGVTTTRYVLDPAAGLTQVLADGTNTYLYGNARLAQYQASMQYFGADGLGSVRQLYDASGQVMGSSRYDPYGSLMSQSGATSVFAFAGEQQDATGLTYLRARYYSSAQGRFTTRDVWEGDPNAPMSYNAWLYAYGNAVNLTDPSGMQPPIPGLCEFLWQHAPDWAAKLECTPVGPAATPTWTPTLPPGTPTLPPTPTLTCTPTLPPTATPTLGPRPTATRQDLKNVAIIATFEGEVLAENAYSEDVYRAIAWTVRNRVATRHEGVTGYSDPNLLAKYQAYSKHKNDQPRSSAVIAVWNVLFAESTATDLTHGVRYFVSADYWLDRRYTVDQIVSFNSPEIVLRYDYQASAKFYGLYFFASWPPPLPAGTPVPTASR